MLQYGRKVGKTAQAFSYAVTSNLITKTHAVRDDCCHWLTCIEIDISGGSKERARKTPRQISFIFMQFSVNNIVIVRSLDNRSATVY